jgi:hypothetical protein
MTFYKFISKNGNELKSGNYIFQIGLNVGNQFCSKCAKNECYIWDDTENSFFFSDIENIHKFVSFGNTLFEVSYPDDAQIIKLNNKYKTNKLILVKEITDFDFVYNIYMKAIRWKGYYIIEIPEQYKTYELWINAVKWNGNLLRYVPEEYKTYELCLEATKSTGNALEFIPDEHKTYELCFDAIKKSKTTCLFEYIPEIHKTYELCREGVESDNLTLKYVSEQNKTNELCITIVKKYISQLNIPQNIKIRMCEKIG